MFHFGLFLIKIKEKMKDNVTKPAWRKFSIPTWFPCGWQTNPTHRIAEFGMDFQRPPSLIPLLKAGPTRAA